MTGFESKRQAAQNKMNDAADTLSIVYQRGFADGKKAAQPEQEPVASPYNPNPVEYQYHYPDGSWRCSNGDAINGMRPDRARSLYALKDNT